MGGVSEKLLDDEDNGFVSGRELFVCSNHFQDEDILKYIENNHSVEFNCDFCDDPSEYDIEGDTEFFKTVSWDQLMGRIVPSILEFYDDPANGLSYESAEGGYFGNVYSSLELLSGEIQMEADFDVIEEIANTLTNDGWTEAEFYGPTYLDHLKYTWDTFSELVKYKIRYLFNEAILEKRHFDDVDKPFLILKDIGRFIKELNLFATFPEKVNLFNNTKVFFRATQFNPKKRKVESCNDIGSAPIKFAGSNRFSPEGISIFYGAEDADVAIEEVINRKKKNQSVSTGKFKPVRPLNLIDLRSIPQFGFFNTEKIDTIEPARFLKTFVANISKKITEDDNERIEYIPSQIITEYFRYILSAEMEQSIDGIVYKSVQDPEKNCYAIFADDQMCADEGSATENTLLVLKKHSITTIKVSDIK